MMRKCLCSEVPRLLNVHQGIFIGSVEEPGTNVRQKSGLNKSISEQTWGMIRNQLAYKAVSVLDVKVFQFRNRSAAHTVRSTVFPDAPRRSVAAASFS